MQYVKPLNLFQNLLKAKALERGRLLGLDVGDKYVGLAVSDIDNKIASPLRYGIFICCWYFTMPSIFQLFLNFGTSFAGQYRLQHLLQRFIMVMLVNYYLVLNIHELLSLEYQIFFSSLLDGQI